MKDHKDLDVIRAKQYESIVEKCDSIRAEEEHRRKERISVKCETIAENVRIHVQLREACAENRSKILQEVKDAETAFYAVPLDTEKNVVLHESLCSMYDSIARMDTHIKWIADDEYAYRASLDAYLKVSILLLVYISAI